MSEIRPVEIGWISVDPVAIQKETFSLYSESGGRTRKYHYKSRNGCNSCKQRRTKCDEKRPSCESCVRRKSRCEYPSPESQKSLKYSKHTSLAPTLSSISAAIECHILTALESADRLDIGLPNFAEVTRAFALENMKHFVECDKPWLKSNLVQNIMQKDAINLAIENPYLLHVILAISAAHKACLTGSKQHWITSMIHYQHTLVLFNRCVQNVRKQNVDALFAASIIHGMMAFINWTLPLNAVDQHPGWLVCLRGTHTFIRLHNIHTRLHESVWQAAIDENISWKRQAELNNESRRGIASTDITCALMNCWSTFPMSQRERFQAKVDQLMLLDGQEATLPGIGGFTSFITDATPEFIQSVQDRDEVALLLVCCWCAIFSRMEQWWISERAISECQNIYKYLYPRIDEPQVRHALDTFVRYCHVQE